MALVYQDHYMGAHLLQIGLHLQHHLSCIAAFHRVQSHRAQIGHLQSDDVLRFHMPRSQQAAGTLHDKRFYRDSHGTRSPSGTSTQTRIWYVRGSDPHDLGMVPRNTPMARRLCLFSRE